MKMSLKLTSEKSGTDMTVYLSGEVNTLTAPELDELLKRELNGVQNLTLDFEKCDYVSSAGLRVLLSTYKKMSAVNGTINLEYVGDGVMDVLQSTGLDVVFGL